MKFRPHGLLALLVAKHHKCNKNEIGNIWWQNQSILIGGFQASPVWWWCEWARSA